VILIVPCGITKGMNESPFDLTNPEKRWLQVFSRTEELRGFHEVSAADVTTAVEALKKEPGSPLQRRTVVRNFAAHVEGFLYMLKQVTFALSAVSKAPFDKKELALLKESGSYVDEGGREVELKFPTFVNNLKFAFKSYSHVNCSAFNLDCGDHRYAYFRKMVEVRNRLMHPKSIKDFQVIDEEIVKIGKAWGWYQEQAAKLLSSPGLQSHFQTKVQPLTR
jgi:hypothetical protein